MKNIFGRLKAMLIWPLEKFRGLSWKKKIVAVILLIVALGILFSVISNLTKKPDYTTAKVTKSDITENVTETGSIIASGRTDVYSPTNGIVREVFVANAQSVEKGVNLLTVESTATDQEKQTAYANLLAAQNALNLEKAKMNSLQAALFAANETFVNDRGVDNPTQEQKDDPVYIQQHANWLRAEADYNNQASVISQAQAQVVQASLAYQATQNATIRSPIAGSISNLAVREGSAVTAITPGSTRQPSPVLVVSSPGQIEALVSLSETDIIKIKDGQKAEIEVNAVGDKVYKGKVARVDDVGTENQGVMRYNVYVEIDDPDEELRSGMSADIEITTKEIEGVLSVPNSAVKPYQGGRAVRVFDNDTNEIKYIRVETGVRGKNKTQITKGLTEGQEVITSLSNERIQRPGLFGS